MTSEVAGFHIEKPQEITGRGWGTETRPGSIRVFMYPGRVFNLRAGTRVPGSQVHSEFTLNLNFHFSIKWPFEFFFLKLRI